LRDSQINFTLKLIMAFIFMKITSVNHNRMLLFLNKLHDAIYVILLLKLYINLYLKLSLNYSKCKHAAFNSFSLFCDKINIFNCFHLI